MHAVASTGMALWAVGALLLFVMPGGLWSDIPGGALFAAGVSVEVLATFVIVSRRLRRN